MIKKTSNLKEWSWVPSLYFAEGLPYAFVMIVSTILYKKLDGDIQISENWRHVLQNEKIDQVFLTDRRKKYLTIHRMDNGFQEKDEKLYNSLCEELSK